MFNEILCSECFTILRFGHVCVCGGGGPLYACIESLLGKGDDDADDGLSAYSHQVLMMMMQTGALLWLPIEKLTLSLQQVSAALLPALKSFFLITQ